MKMEQTEWSEKLAYKIQTPGNYPEESIQISEHGESLKSRISDVCYMFVHFCVSCSAVVGIIVKLYYCTKHGYC